MLAGKPQPVQASARQAFERADLLWLRDGQLSCGCAGMVTLANRDHRQGGSRLEEPSWTSPLFAASPRFAGWDL
jgi:hypothetical protein